MYFRILIYSDYHLLWLFLCSDMLLCLLLGTFYVLYIMCLHICNYIILYLCMFLIDDGTPDLFKSLFDLAQLFIKALLSR